SGEPQALERLWARHLVHEVEVDVEQVGCAVLALAHHVRVPDLLRQRAAHGSSSRPSRPADLVARRSRSRVREGWPRTRRPKETCVSMRETAISTYGQL